MNRTKITSPRESTRGSPQAGGPFDHRASHPRNDDG